MTTTIQINKVLAKRLKELKVAHGAKSMDAVIQHLLGLDVNNNEAAGASSAEEEDDGDAAERKAFQHEKQFFSYEDLVKEDAVIKFYTGLHPMARLWLWNRLKKLVCCLWCFS